MQVSHGNEAREEKAHPGHSSDVVLLRKTPGRANAPEAQVEAIQVSVRYHSRSGICPRIAHRHDGGADAGRISGGGLGGGRKLDSVPVVRGRRRTTFVGSGQGCAESRRTLMSLDVASLPREWQWQQAGGDARVVYVLGTGLHATPERLPIGFQRLGWRRIRND